jgi:hypothetical protein
MKVRACLAVAATVLGLFVLAVPQAASADTATCSKRVLNTDGSTKYQGCAGLAYFMSYGDYLMVDDHYADGFPAVVLWWPSDGTGPIEFWNREGAEGPDLKAPAGDIPEGDWIFYEVCIGSAGNVFYETCSDGVTDYA